ncbi:MAG: PfkB family carbohydrate kinase [Nocardioides sp.]
MDVMDKVALVVGEALVDVVVRPDGTSSAHPGGSGANVAVALARLDRPAWLSTCFADDEHGRLIGSQLDRAGVRLASDPGVVARTSSAIATIGDDGAASYEFDLDWRLGQLDIDAAVSPAVVHTSSLGAVLPPGADDVVAVLEGLRPTATISYDVNARPRVTGTGPELIARVERIAALGDVVKASDEDLAALWPDRSPEESARHLLSLGPAAVVVTRGPQGALWVTHSAEGVVAAVPVVVADTIGAGDTFGAALIDGLWERELLGAEHRDALASLDAQTWHDVLTWAAAVSAVTVSRPGADPPYRHEMG